MSRRSILKRLRKNNHEIVCISVDVEVACYGYEGVDAVKAALREGLNASTEEMPVKVNRFDYCSNEILIEMFILDQFNCSTTLCRYCNMSGSR